MKRRNGFICIAFIGFLAVHPSLAFSQPSGPKVGLALSGGGAKGFAHIGVLKVIDEIGLPVHYISGTSMGAIIGAMYAIGYHPDEIERIVKSTDWQDLFSDEADYRFISMTEKAWNSRYLGRLYLQNGSFLLPAGLIEGQKISSMLSRLTWSVHHVTDFTRFPIPFVALATDIITGQPVPLVSGYLPDALRASLALPSIFTPVKLNGKLLVDGGLVRNLPAQDVRDLGADIVIGVDVGQPLRSAERLKSFVEIIDQALSLSAAFSTREQRELCDILIVPQLDDLSFSSFNQADRLIRLGEAAARRQLPQLLALRDSLRDASARERREHASIARIDSLYIVDVEMHGLRRVSKSLVQAQLGLHPPMWVTETMLRHSVDRIYSSQFFEHVFYRLKPGPRGTRLILDIHEKSANLFHFSARYDNHVKSTILFNVTLRNLTGQSSILSVDIKLGGMTEVSAGIYLHGGLPYPLGLKLHAGYVDSVLDRYQQSIRVARLRVRSLQATAAVGTYYSNRLLLELGLKHERGRLVVDIGAPEFAEPTSVLTGLFGQALLDTRNRKLFPSAGHVGLLQVEHFPRFLGSDVAFQRVYFDWQSFVPLSRHVTLLSRLTLGNLIGGGRFPAYKRFTWGGLSEFAGMDADELFGRALHSLQFGLMFELWPRVPPKKFLIVHWNVGNAFDRWNLPGPTTPYFKGFGITLGSLTPIAPVMMSLSHSRRHTLLFEVQLGYPF
ncbi:MAG: patatin-like phospholipase family protein [candidate division KSB1 bacterium]|nr:patatin-like phospholipase family protein [candidate division KSB1 bacterium]